MPDHGSTSAIELMTGLAINRFFDADYEDMRDRGDGGAGGRRARSTTGR